MAQYAWFAIFVRRFTAVRPLQPIWRFAQRVALYSMNIGGGAHTKHSGEAWLVRRLASAWRNQDRIVAVDGGANKGDYTILLLKTFGPKVQLFAYEAAPGTAKEYLARVGTHPNVTLRAVGLGAKSEAVPFYTDAQASGLASVYDRRLSHVGIEMHPSGTIDLRSLDDEAKELDIQHVHLLKLDIEGHELAALTGARRQIESGAIDVIQFEFGGCNIDSRTFFQDFFYLLSPRYRLFRLLPSGLAPIPNYSESCEVFVTTNFVAIRREIDWTWIQ